MKTGLTKRQKTTCIYFDEASKDFFTYYQEEIEGQTQFDVVVGNPPFIRYQHFTEEYRKVAFALMNNHGFHPNRLTNIWLPFLVLAFQNNL